MTDAPEDQPMNPTPSPAGDPPAIEVAGKPDAIRKLRKALRAGLIPDVYVTDGRLIRIERVSGTFVPDLKRSSPLPLAPTDITPSVLAALLAEHTYTYEIRTRKGKDGSIDQIPEEVTPPKDVLSAVLSGAEWMEMPAFAGIIGTPVLRHDWSLLQEPGYDRASALYLSPTVRIERVPERPDPVMVKEALTFILDTLLGDFEWEDTASKANFVALLVTPFLRRPLKALVPFGLISASTAGSGKSLLSALIGLLVGQQTVPWPVDNEAELKKTITSTFATKASGAVTFDNLPEGEVIESATMANLLTAPVWTDRLLGKSATGSWTNDRLWMATGNNLQVGGDMASRTVYVKLKPKAPHPEQRTDFQIPDLQGWIMNPDNRAHLLRHILVLVADWVAAGTPRDMSVPPMRQFSPWAQGVGGFLRHHGIDGFLGNIDAIRKADEGDRKWGTFLATWLDKLGSGWVKPSDLLDSATGEDKQGSGPWWNGDFISDVKGRYPRYPQTLGTMLAGQVDRWHGDPPLTLRKDEDSHNKAHRYRVERWQR